MKQIDGIEITWFKGVPPVTGYYWFRPTEPRWTARKIKLAELFIDPISRHLTARTEGSSSVFICPQEGDGYEWAGPLPVPETEGWEGYDVVRLEPEAAEQQDIVTLHSSGMAV